jgi:hypothetical protein
MECGGSPPLFAHYGVLRADHSTEARNKKGSRVAGKASPGDQSAHTARADTTWMPIEPNQFLVD